MVRHFFLDKTATIYEDSLANTGLNPIIDLNYGKKISKSLLHFDAEVLKEMVENKTIANPEKLSFKLKMTNCASVDGLPYEKTFDAGNNIESERASSFDLVLFKLPQCFDEGRGYDYMSDFWNKDSRSYSTHGASWYYSQDGNTWYVDKDKFTLNDPEIRFVDGQVWRYVETSAGTEHIRIKLDGGIFSKDYMRNEINKYNSGLTSDIISIQHFDFGNENLCMDITSYVFSLLYESKDNYGMGLSFTPSFEDMKTAHQQHAGFFATHTNTFFHPYIEMIYDEPIKDDREKFYIGKTNNLYLYCNIGGKLENLDYLPTCLIDELGEGEVSQVSKGVYRAEFRVLRTDVEDNTILYDKWTNLAFKGENLDDIEMETVAISPKKYFMIGNDSVIKNNLVPSVFGINDDEKVQIGEIREVGVDFRTKYSTNNRETIDDGAYRLYVVDGNANREMDVIEYTPLDCAFLHNFFILHTEDLVPGDYFVDIKVRQGNENKYFKKVLRFSVVSNVTERYQ